jgi:quinol monooxygenase YgiN
MSRINNPKVTEETSFNITYLDVHAHEVQNTKTLLRQLKEFGSQTVGNLRFEIVQRICHPDQFVIVEAWQDSISLKNYQQSKFVIDIKDHLKHLLRSSFDERPHLALHVTKLDRPFSASKDEIFAITHVDIVPTFKDQGITIVKDISAASEKDSGNIRFEALSQISRPNHMTIVEVWTNQDAINHHASQKHKINFRVDLCPISGSLYDERFYKQID